MISVIMRIFIALIRQRSTWEEEEVLVPEPYSGPNASVLARLKYELSREKRCSDAAWLSSRLVTAEQVSPHLPHSRDHK